MTKGEEFALRLQPAGKFRFFIFSSCISCITFT